MHFVLTLHSHLPWVLNHGRWPHGSDWLCEAAVDTYLPLVEGLLALEEAQVSAPITLGITPVLANQLASPLFVAELEAFFEQRLKACDEAPASLKETGDSEALPLVEYWRRHLSHLRKLFNQLDGDLLGAFRRLEAMGRLEIITSAATHGFLPLLGRDESVRLQLAVGVAEHRRLFGRNPKGCWAPECAYRPGGMWDPIPGVSRKRDRAGLESFLQEAGFRYFFMDAHLAQAGDSLGAYGDVPHGVERFDGRWEGDTHLSDEAPTRSPYQAFFVSSESGGKGVSAFVREPRSSMQVWSRHHGYPGDEWYLEFHKIRWPGGLKYWRVTGPGVDLGEKGIYDPDQASERARSHAAHFSWLLGEIQLEEEVGPGGVTMAPFDTELFGHWWYEGVEFLREMYLNLPATPNVIPVTASQHLDSFPSRNFIRPTEGSWGADGDFSMWLNEETEWTWKRLWPLEDAFWDVARGASTDPAKRVILAQAARQLLLAQSSDWQFMISTGAVPDYAEKRFRSHCDDLGRLLVALNADAPGETVKEATVLARALEERDPLFPDILDPLDKILGKP